MSNKLRAAFDVQHLFFIPLYRRVITVALCFGWAVFELFNDHMLFAVLFGAAGVWCAHQFFWAFDPKDEQETDSQEGGPE